MKIDQDLTNQTQELLDEATNKLADGLSKLHLVVLDEDDEDEYLQVEDYELIEDEANAAE